MDDRGFGGINTRQPGGPTAGGGGYGGASGAGVLQTGLIGGIGLYEGGFARRVPAGIEARVSAARATLSLCHTLSGGNQCGSFRSALSGAMGRVAPAAGLANWLQIESPEVAYQRKMGNHGRPRHAAATGGSGRRQRVQQEQRHAIGLAAAGLTAIQTGWPSPEKGSSRRRRTAGRDTGQRRGAAGTKWPTCTGQIPRRWQNGAQASR